MYTQTCLGLEAIGRQRSEENISVGTNLECPSNVLLYFSEMDFLNLSRPPETQDHLEFRARRKSQKRICTSIAIFMANTLRCYRCHDQTKDTSPAYHAECSKHMFHSAHGQKRLRIKYNCHPWQKRRCRTFKALLSKVCAKIQANTTYRRPQHCGAIVRQIKLNDNNLSPKCFNLNIQHGWNGLAGGRRD